MTTDTPLYFKTNFSELPADPTKRHDALVDLFGQFLFWLRSRSIAASRLLIESEAARESVGTIRRRHYDGVAKLSPEHREAAMLLVEETLDGFAERLAWELGNEGVDARFGGNHAYRFRIEMEIVDAETGDVIHQESINRGGKFFGRYWGRWLNRFRGK